jgi:hypothetical protein
MTWTAPEYARPDEPFTGPERPMLVGFLDRHRAGLLLRCSGLTAGQLAERAVPPSSLSLIGIVRHLTDVERTYFRRRWGEMSMRWVLTHMIGEYAAHSGQADLIRERIDGRTRF